MNWPVNPLRGNQTKPLTGEPCAGNPPARFGGGRGRNQSVLPTPILLAPVSNSERGYHVFSDVGTKLEFVGFNEAVHVRVATDIFSRIGLTRCLSDPYIPSAGCGDLIS